MWTGDWVGVVVERIAVLYFEVQTSIQTVQVYNIYTILNKR